MSNVKPGDFAKNIDRESFPENNGAVVYVERAPREEELGYAKDMGLTWFCRVLEPFKAFSNNDPEPMKVLVLPPGAGVVLLDSMLRRIDPPTDTEEIFDEAPMEEEKREQQIEEKLQRFEVAHPRA